MSVCVLVWKEEGYLHREGNQRIGIEIISRKISNCMGCCAGEQPPARLTDHTSGQNAEKTGSLHSAFLESTRALGH